MEEVELSPRGDRLAYIAVSGETRRLEIQDINGRGLASLGIGGQKVRDLKWVGDDYLMIGISSTTSLPGSAQRYELLSLVGFDLRTKKFARLLENDTRPQTGSRLSRGARVLQVALGDPTVTQIDGQPAALVPTLNLDGSQSLDLFRVDLATGLPTLHERGSEDTVDFLVSPNGEVVAREEFDDDTGRWSLLVRDGAGWKTIKTVTSQLDPPSLLAQGRDGRSIAVSMLIDGERQVVEIAADGKVSAPIEADKHLEGLLVDPAARRLTGVTYIDGVINHRFFDPKREAAWRSIRAGFRGQQVTLQSWSSDFTKVVAFVEGKESGTFYLVDTTAKRAEAIGEAYPLVPPEQVATQKAITYKAADGLEIPAYLTLPVGRPATALPLVVLPHGGPEARDEPGFDWWAQALASRGYAVLQPQFRGSSGFGQDFVKAGYGQWGRKMQTDLSDGVAHLVSQGVVDPKRVCIVGASYGGYAALAGATLQPETYRCAVSVAGLSDLPRLLASEAAEARDRKAGPVRYLERFLGAGFRDRGVLSDVSPAAQAARASGPILLIHGRDDTVVPFEQSTLMQRALQKAGKSVELITLAGEDHWLSREATRLQMLNATVTFLEKHNPPR